MDIVKNNKRMFIYGGIFLFFLCLGIFSYFTYLKPKVYPTFVENKEYLRKSGNDNDENKEVDLILFYTTWCPHSKNALGIWEKFKEYASGRRFKGYIVHFKEVDCDKDEKMSDEFNITGYPTIKLVKSPNEIIEFDAKPSHDTLNVFLDTVL